MRRWIEPYESPSRRESTYYAAGLLGLLGFAMLCGFFGGEPTPESAELHLGYLVPPAGLALCGVYLWRTLHIGVAVGDRGIRVRTVAWTRAVPWSHVERAWVGPVSRKAGRGPGRALWIAVRAPGRDGSRFVETVLWLRGTDDWYGIRNAVLLDAGELKDVVDLINARAGSRLPDRPPRP